MRKGLKVILIEGVEGVAYLIVVMLPLCPSCGFCVVDYGLLAVEGVIGQVLVPSP